MSSDLDDLLRRDDEDAPAIGGEPGRPPRTLTDALNMVASLPQGDDVPAADDDTDKFPGDYDPVTGEVPCGRPGGGKT